MVARGSPPPEPCARTQRTTAIAPLLLSLLAPLLGAPVALPDVLARIDATHPKLAAARQEVAAARGKAREKRGAFDPVLTLGSDTLRYNPSTTPGKAGQTDLTEGAVELTLPSGMKIFAGSRLNRGKVKSPAVATGDLGETFVGLKMPLLRGGGPLNEKAVAERQARLGVPLAERAFDGTRLDVRRAGAGAYWEWAGAARRLRIARDLLTIARLRAEGIRARFQAGDLPEVDAIEADGETERRRGSLAKAERDLQKAAIKLGLYLWTPDGRPQPPPTTLRPPELPRATDLDSVAADAVLRRARDARPELASLALQRETLTLGRDLARADRRPQLDLILNPGVDSGVGGIGNTMKAGLLYSVPLRQNAADGRIEDADAKLAKLEADRLNLSGRIEAEVADAVSAVRAAYRRVVSAETELALARRLERAERDRFDLGEGTLFLLNQRERARAESESRLVDVLVEYHAARADLLAAEGGL